MVAIGDYFSRNVIVVAFFTALISSSIDQYPNIEPVPVELNYALPTVQQQEQFELNAATKVVSSVYDHAEKLLEGEALAAEDMAVAADGRAYMGLRDGRIVSFAPEDLVLRNFSRIGADLPTCGELESEPKCGRPLGVLFTRAAPFQRYLKRIKNAQLFPNDQVMLVADAYKGLHLMDAVGTKVFLFNHANGTPTKFLNALAVTEDGTVYATDSSTRYPRNKVLLDLLEHIPSGRLLRFQPQRGDVEVLAEDLPFPNGLVLADNEQSLLIAMSMEKKIAKFTIRTRKFEDFAFIPGAPDNVWIDHSAGADGAPKTMFVGIVSRPSLVYRLLMQSMKARKILALLPRWVTMAVLKRTSVFATIDLLSGEIQHLYEETTGKAFLVSGVHGLGDHYYLLSWARDYVVRIPKSVFN